MINPALSAFTSPEANIKLTPFPMAFWRNESRNERLNFFQVPFFARLP